MGNFFVDCIILNNDDKFNKSSSLLYKSFIVAGYVGVMCSSLESIL